MALFEYNCAKCGDTFEKIIRSPNDTKGLNCPACGSRRVKRQISRFAANFGPSADQGASCATDAYAGAGCGCGGNCACGSRQVISRAAATG